MLGISGIVRIFEEIEQRLVQSLKRNLGRHKQEEQDEGFNWTAWQAEKLRSLEKFRRENAAIMQEYTEQIDTETQQIMQEQFDEGVNGVDVPPAENQPVFFGVDTTKVNKLIEDVTYLEKNAETAALRLTDDVYRQTVNRVQLAMSTGSMTLQQAIDIAVKDFLNQGINCIVYKDGRRVNIADYVRMALRTTATRATLQGKSAKFKSLGYDTVQVSSYGMCSKTCEPWQGRIYIEDTFSDWGGKVRDHGGILWGKSNYCGKWFPLLSSAIEKGLFHPNCRHSISLWRDGDPLPESVDNTDSERRYKLEQQQRALEREIRKAKRKVEGFTDPENIKKAKVELRQAQKELKDFIDKVNAEEGETVLKRDYGKEKVYEGEAYVSSSSAHEIKSSSDIKFDRIDGSRPITEEFAEEYRKEYDDFTKIFGDLPNLRAISVSPYKEDDVYGRYFDGSREIVLYGVGGKDGKKYISQITQDMKGKGKWSTASPYHTLRHELGHAYQHQLELNDKNWNKKLTLLSNYRQQLAISLTNQPKSGKIKTEKDVLSKYGMFKTDEFISESIAEYADKKDKSRPVAKKTIKILMMGEDNMLMSLPDEMYEYVDITGKEPVVMANAPDYIKKKAEEINAKSIEATGKKFFAEIK